MKKKALTVALSVAGFACFAVPATNYVVTGQQMHEGYLHKTNLVVAKGVSLSDVTGVFGHGGGASTASPKAFTVTPSFWRNVDGGREVQLQFFEPQSVKMVNVRLEQDGDDVVARATDARYYQFNSQVTSLDAPHFFAPATPGVYDFYCGDGAVHKEVVAEHDGESAYGAHHFGVYCGERCKSTVSEPESGKVYSITDGGTLEMVGNSDFAGWIDGYGELKIGDSSQDWVSASVSELQLNNPQTVFERANVHAVRLAVDSIYGAAVGGNVKDITVCNSTYVSETERLVQVQFFDNNTLNAILLRLEQDGDRVKITNYHWKYDKNAEYRLGDDATGWANGGQYLIKAATLYAPATHMNVAITNLSHGAFTVDGAYAKVTSRYTVNQGGAVTVRNRGFLDVKFEAEKDLAGADFNIHGGFGAKNGAGYGMIRVADSSTMLLRGFCIDSKSSLEVSGGSTLLLGGSSTSDNSTYAPYLKIADGSRIASASGHPNYLRMGYVADYSKLWSFGEGCTNVVDCAFQLMNNNANNSTVHLIADADLVFRKNLLLGDQTKGSSLYKLGVAAVEIQGENGMNGTTYVQEGVLRIANDKGLTNNVSLAGGTLEIVSNMTVRAGSLTVAARTLPGVASGGTIVLQPTAALEFAELGGFADGARLIIEGDLSRSALKMPPLDPDQLSMMRVCTDGVVKRVQQDDEGRLRMWANGIKVIVR